MSKLLPKNCIYCEVPAPFYFKGKDYNRKISDTTFNHYRCPNCKLIFISPFPDNLGDYYPDDYHYIPDSLRFLDAVSPHEQYKIDMLKPFIDKGRLLEIGPSLGGFAYAAKKSGYETETIEMDSRCSDYLNNIAEIPTINTDDTLGALAKLNAFDVIAMWHVIEHLTEPWKTLDAIYKKLNPNGILILAAPNPDSIQFKIMGRRWPHVDSPRHLTLIPADLIIDKMTKMGMKLELLTTKDKGGLGWNTFGWEYFFTNFSSKQNIKLRLKRIGLVLSRLFSPLDKIENKGCAYTIIFRKE